jgi:cystathionine beta-lyase
MSQPRPPRRPSTDALHVGRDPAKHLGAVNTPVYRASTMVFPTLDDLEASRDGRYEGIGYGLHGLPTVTDLQVAVAALEGGHRAFAVPSGLTATTLPLLALLSAGDRVLITDSVYGPTRRFATNTLRRMGIEVDYYDPLAGAGIEASMTPDTKVVFVESPGSLSFDVQDVPAIAAIAHRHGATVVMDNSWATPLGFRSFDHGVDVSVHAATKYIGGHSDLLLGLIVCNEATSERIHRSWTDMGVTASSDDAFLGLRGLRTLAVRLARHESSALRIAAWLRERAEVREVLYPALSGARGHELWKRDFLHASGLFSIVLDPRFDRAAIARMLDGMRLFSMGWSWGGYESLMIPVDPDKLRTASRFGAAGPCLRLAIGLDDPDDLIDDLDDGFARLGGKG